MSLTAANAIIMLSVADLFPNAQRLQGFSTDDVFDVEQIKAVETQMGVDGILSGGFVYNETTQSFTLQSDSPSIFVFDQWVLAQQAAQDTFPGSALVTLSGIDTKFSCVKGFLTDYPPMPSVGKLIKPRKYTIRWESVSPAPM